jgi:triacylglycerol lipase
VPVNAVDHARSRQVIWLLSLLAAEAIGLVATSAIVGGASGNLVMVAGAAAGALLVLNYFAVLVFYAGLRAYGRQPGEVRKARSLSGLFHAMAECVALLALFAVIIPFERLWMGSDVVGRLAPGRLPVLLVHGYLCNRGLWLWLRRRLRENDLAVATVNLEPPFAGIDHLAGQLHQRIETLVAETAADRVVLVTHSMGGLVARAYLRRHGSSRVAQLVTLGSPHRGTTVARLGYGRNAREMEPDSTWLRRLNASEVLPVQALSVWSRDDEFIVPHDSGRLAGAREHVLAALGHMSIVFSPAVLQILLTELTPRRSDNPQSTDGRPAAAGRT